MSQQSLVSSNGHGAVLPSSAIFPFTSELSLAPLAAFWHQTMRHDHPVERAVAAQIQHALQEAPALLEPLADVSLIAQHPGLFSFRKGVAQQA